MAVGELDFGGLTVFVGIDVHKKSWAVSFRCLGKALRTFSMPPSSRLFFWHLSKNFPGALYRSVYGAGFSGFWVHRQLMDLGILNIIVSPADVPLTHKEKDRKTDVVDSKKLASSLEKNTLSGIYIPSSEEESFRSLVRLRASLVKKRTRLIDQLKSFLNFIKPASASVASIKNSTYKNWLENDACEFFDNREILLLRFSQLQTVRGEMDLLMKKIHESIKRNKTEALIYPSQLSFPVLIPLPDAGED